MADDSEAWKGEDEVEDTFVSPFSIFWSKPTPEQKAAEQKAKVERDAKAAAAALTRLAFGTVTTCAKCGGTAFKTRWCNGAPTRWNGCDAATAGYGEHLHVRCKTCRYVAYTNVLTPDA